MEQESGLGDSAGFDAGPSGVDSRVFLLMGNEYPSFILNRNGWKSAKADRCVPASLGTRGS